MATYTSTKGSPGSFKRFVSSVAQTVKSVFTPKSEKASYDLGTSTSSGSGQYSGGTATSKATTPSSSSTSRSSGGGGSSGSTTSTPIKDTSGNLVGVDTGTKSIAANSKQKDLDKNLNKKANQTRPMIDERTGKPYGVVSPLEKPEGLLERGRYELSNTRSKIYTKSSRDTGEKPIAEFGRQAAAFGVGVGVSVLYLGLFAKSIITKPKETVKNIPSGIKGSYEYIRSGELSNTLYNEPGYATGIIAGNIVVAKGTGKIISVTSDEASIIKTKISPTYRPVIKSQTGRAISNIPAEAGGEFQIPFAGQVKSISEPLSVQVKLAGEEVRAVSASRNLFSPIKKEVVVNKPLIPGSTSELERSFFADPRGRVRISRLDVFTKEEATIVDILSGDITFKKSKPQIIVFENTKVSEFPRSLKDVESSLISGKQLTQSQAARLEKFQLTPTGEFKPIGFLSKEPEITISPNEIIFKKSNLGSTIIEGKRVQIISADISQPTPTTYNLLEKFKEGKITAPETKILRRNLLSETGFDLKSYYVSSEKYISAPSLGLRSTILLKKYSEFYSGKGSLFKQLSLISPRQQYQRSEYYSRIPSPKIPSPVSPSQTSPVSTYSRYSPKALYPPSPIITVNFAMMSSKIQIRRFTQYKQSIKLNPQLFPQPKKYQPTFAAAALNIRSAKIPKAYSAGAGALIQRPIISRRKI